MFAAFVGPAVVQADKITNIERDEAAVFLRGEIQLGFVGQAGPLFFNGVNDALGRAMTE